MRGYRNQVQPAQYVSQYDPAANDMTQKIIQARSNRFEQSYASLAQEQAQQGSIFFLDENAKKQTLGKFNEEKERILQKYEGDFEAAAPELTKLVVQERANPIYQLNKLQQDKMQGYQKQVDKIGAENIIPIKEPPQTLVDENGRLRNPDEFDYEVYDRSKIQAKGANWLSQIKPTERTLQKTADGKFYEQIKEITQKDFIKNLTDDKVSKFLETAPELARIAETQNQDPIEFARQYLISEGQGIVGIHDRSYIANPDYKDSSTKTTPSNYWETTTIPRSIQKNNQTEKFPTNPDDYDETKSPIGVKSGWGGVNAPVNNEKAIKNKENVINFVEKHPELNASNTPIEQIADVYNQMQDYYSAEFGSLTQPSFKYKLQQGDELFYKGTKENGKHGDIVLRKFNVYDEESNKHPMFGADKIKNFTELSGYKNSKDALINTSYQGITFTGDLPGAILATTLKPNGGTLELQVSPGTEVEQISSTVWATAEAIRTDNNSSKLDNLGNNYGIKKDEDGNYKIKNNIPTLKSHGIDYFKVKNEIVPTSQGYIFVPTIEAYTEDGKLFSNLDLNVNDLADYTLGILESTNFLQPEK